MIENALLGARLLRPYYARALAALRVVNRDRGTIAVDLGWRLYVNTEWFASSCSAAERAGLIAGHEIEHLLRRHGRRLRLLDPLMANLSGDLEIESAAMGDIRVPIGGVTPAGFGLPSGLLAEEYANRLANPAGATSFCSGGSGAGRPLADELPADGGTLGDAAGALDEAAATALCEATARDVLAHERAHPGTVPASIRLWADVTVLPVSIDWRLQLSTHLRDIGLGAGDQLTRSRLPRRYNPEILRSAKRRASHRVAVIVDVSGSMTELGVEVLSAVESLVRRLSAEILWIVCDAEVKSATRHRPVEWYGGGGTDLRLAFDRVPSCTDAIVCITDCETPWPQKPPEIPVTVVAIGPTSSTPSWTTTVRVPER